MKCNLLLDTATEAVTETAENAAAKPQSLTDMMDLLMIVLLIGCGVYAMFSALKLRKLSYLFPNSFIYPGNCKPDDCTDAPGFIIYIFPRLMILGAGMLVFGILFLLATKVLGMVTLWVNIVSVVLPLALFGWYIVVQRRAAKRFW